MELFDIVPQLLAYAPVEVAPAAEQGGAAAIFSRLGVDIPKLITQLITFTIVLLILRKFAYQPILTMLEKRREKIRESLENAEKVEKELAEAEITRKNILKEANEKANEIVAQANETAQAQVEQKIQAAVAEAERIVAKAKDAGRMETEKMKQAAREEIGDLVVATTARVAGKTLTDEDQKRLSDEAKQLAIQS